MSPESAIGHYRITSKLGEGGMGAVFRATDTKLGRDVAIKVLPESFAADPDRVARFTREAQVLASLNHPNIAAIYGVEDRSLVMELIPGATLAERIAQGPIPQEEALAIAKQIAEALEYAHERGIIHRDLKPANIKVTPEGRAKVLDFGLAKALAKDLGSSDPASSPTITMGVSMAGLILGTAGYMSPEQAKGRPVDRRVDIWAFGVVLAEMLSGRFLYASETVSETLAAVLLKEPDFSHLPPSTDAGVRKLLRRCLDKDPSRRLRDIGEARVAIDEILAGSGAQEPPSEVAPRAVTPARRKLLPWAIAGALSISTIGASWIAWRASQPADRAMMRFSVDLGPDSAPGAFVSAVLSPDGRRIVYTIHGPNGNSLLATRLLDQSKVSVLAGTENAEHPFFSPDGRWIGFFAGRQLNKISVQGGAAVTVCATTTMPRGATWGEDDYIIANLDNQRLFRVPASGGTPEVVGNPAAHGERTWRFPQMIGKQHVLFTGTAANIGRGYDDANLEVLSLDTGQVKIVQRGGYSGRYLPSGHLVYIRQGALHAIRFDPDRLETRGVPAQVLDDVGSNSVQGAGQIAFSDTGTFIYRSGTTATSAWDLSWIDSAGKATPVWKAPAAVLNLRLSPDGNRVAGTLDGDIVVYEPQRADPSRVTFTAGEPERYFVWSPDGKYFAYSTAASRTFWWVRADGSSQPVKLADLPAAATILAMSISPDGRSLAFVQGNEGGTYEIWNAPLDIKDPDHPRMGKPELSVPAADDPAFSPDGRWLAYTSYEAAGPQVFVRPFPGGPSAGKWQISAAGRYPVWTRSGRQLFFLGPDDHVMFTNWQANGDRFAADRPHHWSSTQIERTSGMISYDVAPDGRRVIAFPVRAEAAETASVHVTVLLNFFDELKRRVP